MESEAEPELSSTPKLPLFSIPPMMSPEHPGMLTPPLHTSVSVPFRWEEEPGKPRPCTAVITLPNPNSCSGPKCLELPPRLLMVESKITKTPSPTTVLDGPYVGRSIFSSFRLRRDRQGSFDTSSRSPEKGQLGAMVLGKKRHKGMGFFGSWGQKTVKLKGRKKEAGGGSFVFSSSMEQEDDDDDECGGNTKVKIARIGRNGSFSSLSSPKSHFWAAMYEGFKQAITWNSSRKSKKEGFVF